MRWPSRPAAMFAYNTSSRFGRFTQTSVCEAICFSTADYDAVYNKYCNSICLCLANEIQQYNGELQSSDRKYKLPICQKTESIESTKLYRALLLRRYYPSLAKEMPQSNGNWTIPFEYKNSIWQIDRIDIIEDSLWGYTNYGDDLSYLTLANQMQMASWIFPIDYIKNSPFEKSNESIESTTVYRPLLLGRTYLSLANEMQQSNGKLDYSDRI